MSPILPADNVLQQAVAHAATPTAAGAKALAELKCNRHGIPFVLGGHPNLQTIEYMTAASRSNDTASDTVGADELIVLTGLSVMVDFECTTHVTVRMGFGVGSVPAEPTSGNNVTGVVFSHPGIAAGSGVVLGNGTGIIGIGAVSEELRITNSEPTDGQINVIMTYFLIAS